MLTTLIALCSIAPLGPVERPLPFMARYLRPGHHFVVCAHRGDHVLAPENTLDAFEEAARNDVDFMEIDLRTSKDGEIVVMHDDTVDRMTDGTGKVADLTLPELKALKFKKARRDGEKVPTFDEVLKKIHGKINIYMDIKAVHPAQILPLLKKYKMEANVIAYVYSAEQRDEWRTGAPNIPLISDLRAMASPEQIEEDWKKSPFAITDGSARAYKPELIEKWHALGVGVVPDIQNPAEAPSQWKPMIDMGVDGLQTDHPEQLIAYLKELGIR